jgi:hypothetical protein
MDVMDNKVCKMAMIRDPNGHAVMLHQISPDRLRALQAKKRGAAAKPAKPARAAAKAKPAAKARPAGAKASARTRSAAKARRR